MSSFDDHWNFIVDRSAKAGIPVVQDKSELEYVFNLMRGCGSYLEVGTAEGNSLYVLSQALTPGAEIVYIDWNEPHTRAHREEVISKIGRNVSGIHEDSNSLRVRDALASKLFDVVLIDAGHLQWNVVLDAVFYGHLARKYVVFHDIKIPDVERAFAWYCKQRPECKSFRIVNSDQYGYGVLEI